LIQKSWRRNRQRHCFSPSSDDCSFFSTPTSSAGQQLPDYLQNRIPAQLCGWRERRFPDASCAAGNRSARKRRQSGVNLSAEGRLKVIREGGRRAAGKLDHLSRLCTMNSATKPGDIKSWLCARHGIKLSTKTTARRLSLDVEFFAPPLPH